MIDHRVILHIQQLRYQKSQSLIIKCQFCLLMVFPWKMRIVISPYCTVYQNYTRVLTNNAISQKLPIVLPILFLNLELLFLQLSNCVSRGIMPQTFPELALIKYAPHICPTYFHNQNITDTSDQKWKGPSSLHR